MTFDAVLDGTGYQCAPLSEDHFLMDFQCGHGDSLATWLRDHAKAFQEEKLCQVWILSPAINDSQVLGYFTLSLHSIVPDLIRKADKYVDKRNANEVANVERIPAILLGKFALDESVQGRSLGTALMMCAYAAHLAAVTKAGGKYMIVEAREPELVSYYERFGFVAASANSSLVSLYRPTSAIEADMAALSLAHPVD